MRNSDGGSERTLNAEAPPARDAVNLYNVLGVDQRATPVELKRAYRRLALQHHPDRNPGAAADGRDFVRIQYAYDMLSDERKRRIYDRYGEMGIQMAGRVGGELLDPQVSNMLSGFAFVSSLVALLFVLFFTLLAQRVDRKISWPYSVVFAPLWTVDLAVLIVVLWALLKRVMTGFSSSQASSDYASRNEDAALSSSYATTEDDEYEGIVSDACDNTPIYAAGNADTSTSASHSPFGSAPATDATPLLGGAGGSSSRRRRRRSRRHRQHPRLRTLRKFVETQLACLAKAAPIAYLLLLALFQVSIVLKLDSHVSWSVWRVAAPWLAIEAINGMLLTLQLLAAILKANEGAAAPTGGKLIVVALDTYWWFIIRVLQAVLIILRLNHSISWYWAVVFAPSFLPGLRSIVTLCLLRKQLRAMGDAEVAQNENAIVLASVVAFVVAASFVYSFVALLIWKLSLPSAVRLALVLIPVFIALSLLCCLCTCLSCCLAYGMHAPLDDERDAESNGTGNNDNNEASMIFVPSSRRIE
ncbi:hypothetical protein IWW37_004657 [Coemansia sp. RSA 2050]|nr:hypothetical protein IWW37_004657 [Coemansia sp. RSA 2050]KAJ2730687.1 hypothetical protein IW152_005082 [Coemansia sp. BCRC 34962]